MSRRNIRVLWGLLCILLLCGLICMTLGRYPMSLSQILGILLSRVYPLEPFWAPVQESLFLQHRLPRILLSCMVGGCLSTAGAAYQGVFRNPMAAPDLLGASTGAGLGAALAILLGFGSTAVILFAFLFSLATVALVMAAGSRIRGAGVAGLILAGIMVGSLASSATSFLKLVADPTDQLPAITYWLMGSLNGARPRDLLLVLPGLLGLVPLLLLRWRINLLTLGDEEARSLGTEPRRLRAAVILFATLSTAASVAVSGVIGWVGLVVPHLCRRMVGNNCRYLLPASTLCGALFLLLVDTVSRNLLAVEIPLGILTGFLGVPFFLWLLRKE